MKLKEMMEKMNRKMFAVGLGMVFPLYVGSTMFMENILPRKDIFKCLTIPQAVEKFRFTHFGDYDYLEENKSVDAHVSRLESRLDLDDIGSYKHEVWKYIQYWHRTKDGGRETGSGYEAFSDLVKGVEGSCTEGSVIGWVLMQPLQKDPKTDDSYEHKLLMISYKRSDMKDTAMHCLYLGIRTNKNGAKHYFTVGANPFEDPQREYEDIESLVAANTDLFRMYSFQSLTANKILVQPDKILDFFPSEVGVDIIYGEDRVNHSPGDRKVGESMAEFRQRRILDHFDKNARIYQGK